MSLLVDCQFDTFLLFSLGMGPASAHKLHMVKENQSRVLKKGSSQFISKNNCQWFNIAMLSSLFFSFIFNCVIWYIDKLKILYKSNELRFFCISFCDKLIINCLCSCSSIWGCGLKHQNCVVSLLLSLVNRSVIVLIHQDTISLWFILYKWDKWFIVPKIPEWKI